MHFLSGDADARAMCEALGITEPAELFRDVPESVRTPLDIREGRSELGVLREMRGILERNRPFDEVPHFLGAGAEPHFVPSVVRSLLQRGEFLTSYTPYQPEITQGFLQAMWEFQTYVCRLTELDVANISMYDGATALAEAALLSVRASRGDRFVVPEHVLPERRSVLGNYLDGIGVEVVEVPWDRSTGRIDLGALEDAITEDTAGVYLENPNVFGLYETDADRVRGILDEHAPRALFVVGVHPLSLGLVRGPGAYGADVAVGEGQPLGQPQSFGGPYLGLFATREEHLRKVPGRIVGQTRDAEGERAYTLTLQTREQHIRRARATSNICTNEGMNALAATVYLATLGEAGFREVAEVNAARARALATRLDEVPGFEAPAFPGKHFNTFVLESDAPVESVELALQDAGLRGGLDLTDTFPDLGNAQALTVTELHPEDALDTLVSTLREVGA